MVPPVAMMAPALACEHLGELHALRLRVRVEVRRRVDHKEAVLVACRRRATQTGSGHGSHWWGEA
eukprot:3826310-Prymnesium_polylepis.1